LAVTVVLAAGIVMVVEIGEAPVNPGPVQLWKYWPAGGVLALIETTFPAA
jgi:hypothetical protein